MAFLRIILLMAAFAGIQAGKNDNKRMRLNIAKHQPCTSDDAPLEEDPDKGDGCYAVTGKVVVTKPINGTVQLYTVNQFGTNAEPEKCQGADRNNCGGVGSCIYCDACKGIKQLTKSAVQLVIGGNTMNCTKGLAAKTYNDIKVSFCMPTKKEFLEKQHMDEEFFDKYGADRLFFITMYVFNEQVNKLSKEDLAKIATPTNSHVIGCHKLVGNVFYDHGDSSSDSS